MIHVIMSKNSKNNDSNFKPMLKKKITIQIKRDDKLID